MSVFICEASLILFRTDKQELEVLPLEQFQQLRGGRWGNWSPVSGFVLCTISRKEVVGFKRKVTFILFDAGFHSKR